MTNNIYLALFEGGLLCKCLSVREMYDHISESYSDDPEVYQLFKDLKADWNAQSSIHPYKMIGPFIDREKSDSDYFLARYFTEFATYTATVDLYWTRLGYAYLLKKHLKTNAPKSIDLQMARDIYLSASPKHPLMTDLFSFSSDPTWTAESFYQSEETVSFPVWAKDKALNTNPAQMRCLEPVKKAVEDAAAPEILQEIHDQWNVFTRVFI